MTATCPNCGRDDLLAVEYAYDHPCHYDGISEWRCECGTRIGRWSGRVLEDAEAERPFGGKP